MTQVFNQYICIMSNFEQLPDGRSFSAYTEGQVYLFHEDAPPPEKYFKMIVDENDFPVKVRVRG